MPSKKVKAFLDDAGVSYELMEHDTAFTAQEVAAATHVKGKELIKAIMVKAGDEMVMLALPSTRKVDFKKLREKLDQGDVELASEEEFKDRFPDCETGAMPPLGKLYDVKVLADESMADDEEIAFNAGTHHDVIKISLEDYKTIEDPVMADFTHHI